MKAMGSEPKVWVLLGQGSGGNGQMTSLAETLRWPYELKQLVYNPLNHLPNLILGASLMSLNRHESSPLTPPWPDLVIAASRRSAPVARWIKQQSGGRTRLVHLLHAQAPLHHFDLIITTPQYRLPNDQNILHNTAPLNRIPRDRLVEAMARWDSEFRHLERPYSALLVGGTSSSYVFDEEAARHLGCEASAHVRTHGGSLLVTTSPRTPPASVDALFRAIDCPAYCYRWRKGDGANPYFAYLALADDFIVTVDSASLIVEACLTDKPVAIFEWPSRLASRLRRNGRSHVQSQLRAIEKNNGVHTSTRSSYLFNQLVYWGLIKPSRDFEAYHQVLKDRGLITQLGETPDQQSRQPLDDMERAITRIHQLFDEN